MALFAVGKCSLGCESSVIFLTAIIVINVKRIFDRVILAMQGNVLIELRYCLPFV